MERRGQRVGRARLELKQKRELMEARRAAAAAAPSVPKPTPRSGAGATQQVAHSKGERERGFALPKRPNQGRAVFTRQRIHVAGIGTFRAFIIHTKKSKVKNQDRKRFICSALYNKNKRRSAVQKTL